MSEPSSISITGAREHNLKGVSLEVPKKKLVVFTGPSGSGKSSLAIDTIYAEGRRRFVESLSAYARQFLGQKEKPRVDRISGLSPCIAVEQKSASTNPRSTVGTITEIADYVRVLFARLGVQHCPRCGRAVEKQTSQQVVERIRALPEGTRLLLLAPRVLGRKGEHKDVLDDLRKKGLVRARVDGEVLGLDEVPALDKKKKHTIEAVVDRIVVRAGQDARLADSVETALRLGEGRVVLHLPDGGEDRLLSEKLACDPCGLSFPELSPPSFSFNSPQGMCPECHGLGTVFEVDEDALVSDPSLSLRAGAIAALADAGEESPAWRTVEGVARAVGIDLDAPFASLPERAREALLHGTGQRPIEVALSPRSKPVRLRWDGLVAVLRRTLEGDESDEAAEGLRSARRCRACGGARLREESRHVRVAGTGLDELSALPVHDAAAWVDALPSKLSPTQRQVAQALLKEIRTRLRFLENVGLDYLTLERPGPSLSGGESQRIQLASQLGSELSGVIYVLDEPSIGLHARDAEKLIATLESLRDLGNTVIVVEHDRETIERADWVVDFGPGAGKEGGEVTAQGPPGKIRSDERSLTGRYLSGALEISVPASRRKPSPKHRLLVRAARANNLKGIDISIPLGVFVCVTGVSGAGKSSLVNQILLPALERRLMGARGTLVGEHDSIEGVAHLDKVIAIDQQPIGRTPRSNPATYVKVMDPIRELFATLPEAKAFGFDAGRFSPNVKGGRCEACEGSGVRRIEMHFLADVWVTCEACQGKRFNDATLRVTYRGYSIAQVLDLTVREALDLFRPVPQIARLLETLDQVGLGYVALGQTSPTLSGGEAQRVKLAKELGRVSTGRTLYVLDEPSTGLHFDDVKKLLSVLERLVEKGNTVVVIEHSIDIVKTADWIIDLGPEGGEAGGELVAEGTPEEVAKVERSHTGRFLAKALPERLRPRRRPRS